MNSLAQKTTRDRLFDACNTVFAEVGDLDGVTADKIYDVVGRGSRQTVLAVLREWKSAKSASPPLLEDSAPPEARAAATQMWDTAKVFAAREFETRRREFALQLEELDRRATESDAQARHALKIASEQRDRADALSTELEALKLQLQLSEATSKQHISSLEAQVQSANRQAQIAVNDAANAIDAEKARSAKALHDEQARVSKAEQLAHSAVERAEKMGDKVRELSAELGREQGLRKAADRQVAEALSVAKRTETVANERQALLNSATDRLRDTESELSERDEANRILVHDLGVAERALLASKSALAALRSQLKRSEGTRIVGGKPMTHWMRNRVIAGAST